MSYVNGILTVPAFTPTGNPGEYTITGATYNNQGDNTGQGAAAIVAGFVLYVQASDVNTFAPIPGKAHRYEVTAVTVVNQNTVNLTVIWDEGGTERDTPTNGVDCIITSVSTSNKYGFSTEENLYPSLAPGLMSAMLNVDVEKISNALAAANAVASSVNGKLGPVQVIAGQNIVIDNTGADIVISSTGANEGTYP